MFFGAAPYIPGRGFSNCEDANCFINRDLFHLCFWFNSGVGFNRFDLFAWAGWARGTVLAMLGLVRVGG